MLKLNNNNNGYQMVDVLIGKEMIVCRVDNMMSNTLDLE